MAKSTWVKGGAAALAIVITFGGIFIAIDYPASMNCSRAVEAATAIKIWRDNQTSAKDIADTYARTGSAVALDTTSCPGKAFLHITYDTDSTRSLINTKVQETPLRQIPIEWQNI